MKLSEFKSKEWLIVLSGALFFFYSFFHTNLMNSLMPFLQQDFSISGGEIGLIAAFYFYANVIFLLPAGVVLDRFPIKKLFLFNMIIVILSTLILALSTSTFGITFARFLAGITAAFGLIICLKLASLWLPASEMALASSIIISVGMLGGFASQTPVTTIATWFGWRWAVFAAAFLGVAVMWIILRYVKVPEVQTEVVEKPHILKSLSSIVSRKENWFISLFITLLNIPVAVLGALFGIDYLSEVHGVTTINAASIISMIFIGMLIGSPFFGCLAGRLKKKKLLMYAGALSCLVLTLMLLYLHFSPWHLYILVLLIGFTSGAQVLGYPMIAEMNESHLVGTAFSFAALMVIGIGYGLFLPFVGWLIGILKYQLAMFIIPLSIAVSIALLTMFKEKSEVTL